ncbi:tyrosine-protein phosphatase Lar-like, partial [Mercenaria mercenaria]|uniref:tyrosine-protein phosphatase Lar-like n=1 Tax=Mercenaria mercenaria TaxID=6596 RepID=UPI00234EF57C
FKATCCLIDKVDAFWNYTVQVTAKTIAGVNGSETVLGTTAQSTPGNVTNVQLKPEEEVTKPRTLKVSWEEPKKRDLNGILTEYHIRCTKIDDKSVVYSNRTASNIHSCVMTDIQPGIYNVQVFAATVKGNGSRVTRMATVLPGAPLKLVEETENSLLMQQSQVKPADDERQIAVKLPLRDLLCNIRNGKLTRWGVIVSQESQATDKTFSGSTTAFDYKVSNTYKSWFQVKDMDRISPYITTPRDWKVHCLTFYGSMFRRKK